LHVLVTGGCGFIGSHVAFFQLSLTYPSPFQDQTRTGDIVVYWLTTAKLPKHSAGSARPILRTGFTIRENESELRYRYAPSALPP
jgi:hypothetical protein